MKKLLVAAILIGALPVLIYTGFPYVWKLFGGTFLWSNSVVYKGELLFEQTEDCSVAVTDDFKEIKQLCPGKNGLLKRVWIDGVEVVDEAPSR